MEERGDRPEAEGRLGDGATEGMTPADAPAGAADDLAGLSAKELAAKVRETREEAQRNWQQFLHSAADLENYKRHAARDRQDAVERIRRQMLGLVLGVLDNLERALAFGAAPDASAAGRASGKALVDGLRMTHRQILDQLAAMGVRPIEVVGKPFDPRLHEAVSLVEPEQAAQEAGTVADEVLKGYRFNDDILRPAKVTVVADRRSSGKSAGGGA